MCVLQADIDTFRSTSFPPPMVQASGPNRIIKSKANALEVHPAYGPEVGSRSASDARLVAPAPPLVVPGSSAVNGESKKRTNGVDESQANPNAPKRAKLATDAVPSPSAVNRQPPPNLAAQAGAQPPVRPVIKRPPPSLFVPKKVRRAAFSRDRACSGSLISFHHISASNSECSSLTRQCLSVVLSISHVITASRAAAPKRSYRRRPFFRRFISSTPPPPGPSS